MSIEDLTQLISSCGFPVVAFLIMTYMLKYFYDMNMNAIQVTIKGLTDSVERLKDTMLQLYIKGGGSIDSDK